jgi:hypothetical protein
VRQPRIKAPKGENGLYHCIDRIVGGDYLLGDVEKEMFVRIMWNVAAFLSVKILDYCVLDTHGHKLVFTPGRVELSDEELLARLRAYYGEKSPEARSFAQAMRYRGSHYEELRAGYMRRMGDISEFEKSHKQKFTTWYNQRHERSGTLWMGRFESLFSEDVKTVRQALATYIDLNPVRAGMVKDPKDYRFCGYGAALAGDRRCQRGIMRIMEVDDWKEAAAQYRLYMIQEGHKERAGKRGRINRELLLATLEEKGELPRHELFQLRIRYFTRGLVLGTEAFVERVFERHRHHFGRKRRRGAWPLQGFADGPLRVLNPLLPNPFA